MSLGSFNNLFGDADLFLIDWILKGNVPKGSQVLDAGSGSGRNLMYFLQNDYQVKAIDQKKSEIDALNFVCKNLGKPPCGMVGTLANLPFSDRHFDFIICSRVLHFADDHAHFVSMLREIKRVLKTDGTLYLTMASVIGFDNYEKLNNGKVSFNDGSIRFAMTESLLERITSEWKSREESRTLLFGKTQAETSLFIQP